MVAESLGGLEEGQSTLKLTSARAKIWGLYHCCEALVEESKLPLTLTSHKVYKGDLVMEEGDGSVSDVSEGWGSTCVVFPSPTQHDTTGTENHGIYSQWRYLPVSTWSWCDNIWICPNTSHIMGKLKSPVVNVRKWSLQNAILVPEDFH